MIKFDMPIPGQSLTDTPKNAPYENPPEMVDPEEALMYHIDRLNDEERMENTMFLLEYGFDIQTVVSGILRAAVMEGMHTIDVSLIIAPVLHEFIKGNADATGTKYKEGFEDDGKKAKLEYTRNKMKARKQLAEMKGKTGGPKDIRDELEAEMPEEEVAAGDMPAEPVEAPKKGLMARGGM